MSVIHGWWCNAVARPIKCAFCGNQIFLFVCDHGSKVLFERLGPPWPKHNCHGSPGNSWRDGDSVELTRNPPSTSEKQPSPSAEVKLDRKLIVTLLSDTSVYTMYKSIADAGGMVWYGIKDAAHLEAVVKAQGKDVILRSKIAAAKQGLLDLDKQGIEGILNAQFQGDDRKNVSGRISFFFNEEEGDWRFKTTVKHSDLRKNSSGSDKGNGKLKNENDLPNAKPTSKKPRPKKKRNGNRKNGVVRSKGVWAPLAQSHGNSNKYAYFVLKSLGVEQPKFDNGRSALYRKDNLSALLDKTEKTRNAINFRECPDLDRDDDTKEKQQWVVDLNVALAKYENKTIKKWQK